MKFIRTEHIYREEKVIASSLIRVYQSLSNSGFPYRLSTVNANDWHAAESAWKAFWLVQKNVTLKFKTSHKGQFFLTEIWI